MITPRPRTRVLAALAVLTVPLVGVVVAPAAHAEVEHDLLIDLGTARAAGVLVCLEAGGQSCGESSAASADGVARFSIDPGSYVACVTESEALWGDCDDTSRARRTVVVASRDTTRTYRFPLRSKATDPVAGLSAHPMSWRKTSSGYYAWSYEWGYDFSTGFAPSIAKPWKRTRLLTQSGIVLRDFGKESVSRSTTGGFSVGGGTTIACGFAYAGTGKAQRPVPVASTTLELTVPVASGTRTYRASAAADLSRCGKPVTLVDDSVRLSRTPRAGATVAADVASWPDVKQSYRWYLAGKRVKGATSRTYKLPASAAGKVVEVRVTASGKGYRTATRAASGLVHRRSLGTLKKPTVTGTAKTGRTLRVVVPKVTGVKKARYAVRWYAGGKKVAGATRRTFRLTSAQVGERVAVRVTVTKKGYATKTAVSKKTAVVRR